MSQLADKLSGLDDYIHAEIQKWHVPGMAVAVVHDGEVIHQQGYGVCDIDHGQAVEPNTLFAIGSCTKAFTSMALALLVEDGLLDWDRPIRDYMPQFRLNDATASAQMTARDLVCHRSGLPRHDLMWYGSAKSRWELLERLQHLQPSYPLRYIFQYQNLMYMVAGCLIETITGETWEAFVQKRIFDVLGMNTSLFSVLDAEKAAKVAWPHEYKNEAIQRIPFRNIDAIGPAGSIHSNLPEMLTWLKLHMNQGIYGDTQFVSEDKLKQMHQPHVTIAPQPPMDFVEIQHSSYGLGWAQHLYRGHVRVRHTGGIDGFITDVSFMPQEKLGVIVFNNGGDSLSITAAMHIYDCLLGLTPIDWRQRYKEADDTIKNMASENTEKFRSKRKTNTSPSHPLPDYVGEYEHAGYGLLAIKLADDAFVAVYNGLEFHLSHFHFDVFEAKNEFDDDAPIMPVTFKLDVAGNISEIALQMEPTVAAITFRRNSDQ